MIISANLEQHRLRRAQYFTHHQNGKRLVGYGDLAPIESWGDGSQNCLQNMRIVGNTQLVWNCQ